MAGQLIPSYRAAYSISSATNSATGSAIDSRIGYGFYSLTYCTGGTAVVTVQASHSLDADAQWLPVLTHTALNNTAVSGVSLNYYPYLRAQVSGYAGATASVFIAPGIG